MVYVFSDTLVCDNANAEAAKTVMSSCDSGVKSVTLDGDVEDLFSTLSSASAPSSSSARVRVQELHAAERWLGDPMTWL